MHLTLNDVWRTLCWTLELSVNYYTHTHTHCSLFPSGNTAPVRRMRHLNVCLRALRGVSRCWWRVEDVHSSDKQTRRTGLFFFNTLHSEGSCQGGVWCYFISHDCYMYLITYRRHDWNIREQVCVIGAVESFTVYSICFASSVFISCTASLVSRSVKQMLYKPHPLCNLLPEYRM